jgi:tRNA-splicing ligase RtcB (3'-phosphate/5'-hydroxy nucleic acid ligase)
MEPQYRIYFAPERGQRVPVYVWARALDAAALRQLTLIASQPYVVDHVAAMPDVHVAEGVSVGTVFATLDTLVPAALGGDLGCGMCAARFDAPAAALSPRELNALLDELSRAIPVGDATHRGAGEPLPEALAHAELSTRALERQKRALGPRHLGTLGGGNHFLELDRGAGGELWVVVHTGSRGLGAEIAAHHKRAAMARGGGALAGLSALEDAGRAYAADAAWAADFAKENRRAILSRAKEVISRALGAPGVTEVVDVHHNFVAREEHGGRPLYVHRKGATAAGDGELGLIPGSMGTASYVVVGRGAPASFASCSHGAGRVMTRREARDKIHPASLERVMRRVVFDKRKLRDLVEEAPAAYRDIKEVIEDQADLVSPLTRLEPIAVLKG